MLSQYLPLFSGRVIGRDTDRYHLAGIKRDRESFTQSLVSGIFTLELPLMGKNGGVCKFCGRLHMIRKNWFYCYLFPGGFRICETLQKILRF